MKPHHTRPLLAAAFLLGGILLTSTSARAADVNATLNSGGNWNDPTIWSSNPLFPNNGEGGFTYDVFQSGNTVTVNQAITIEQYAFTGGVNTGAGLALTLNDVLTWSGSAFNGTGTVTAYGVATLSGGLKTITNGRVLELNNSTSWSAGNVRFNHGSLINNNAGFTTNFDGAMEVTGSGGSFNNTGTFTKGGGTGSTVFNANFNNSGTVNVNSGTLRLTFGTSTGAFSVAGGTLEFSDSHSLNAGTGFSGAGTVSLTAGTLTVNAAVSSAAATAFSMSGGTLNGAGTLTVNGPLTWTGGMMTGAKTTHANGGTTLSGGIKEFAGGVLNLNSATTWSAGNVRFNGGAVMNNTIGSTFTTNFDGTMLHAGSGGTFNNAGTFTKSGGAGITAFSGAANFNNSGTVNVNSGTLVLGTNGTHTGAFSVAGGTLEFSGTYNLNAGTGFSGAGTVAVTGGTQTVNAAVSSAVETAFNMSGGTLNGAGTLTVNGPMTWTGGQMSGAGTTNAFGGVAIGGNVSLVQRTLNLDGSSSWTAGTISSGTPGSSFNILPTGSLTTTFDGTMTNPNSVSTVSNAGTFTKSGGTGTTNIEPTFSNTGTVHVQTGTLAMSGGANPYNQSGPSSFTILSGGAMIDTSSFNLSGGTLKGNGTIDGPLTANTANATTIAPGASPGTITINGSTVLGNSNTLAIEVGGLTQGIDYDLLDVNGVLTLGGLLQLTLINGFWPQIGDQFDIVTTNAAVLLSFSNVANGGFIQDVGLQHTFQVHYGASSLYNPNNVTLLAITPEPSRALLLALGLAAAMQRRRSRA